MKSLSVSAAAFFFLILTEGPATAAPILFNWALNLNGEIYESGAGDSLPQVVDASGFNWESGLGLISLDIGPGASGDSSVILFLDHDVDQATTNYYNEYCLSGGFLSTGQVWETDEPGFVHGDIYENFLAGTPDNTNALASGPPDDVSLVLGWNIHLEDARHALVTFHVTQDPSFISEHAGFYLSQVDAETMERLYLYSTITVPDAVPVPEPCSVALLILGVAWSALMRKRSIQ